MSECRISYEGAFELLVTNILLQTVKDLDYAGSRVKAAKEALKTAGNEKVLAEREKRYLEVIKKYGEAEAFVLSDDFEYLNLLELDPYDIVRRSRRKYEIKAEDLNNETWLNNKKRKNRQKTKFQ